jgi:hypothetical protein
MAEYDFMSQPLLPQVNQWGTDTFSNLSALNGQQPSGPGAPGLMPTAPGQSPSLYGYTPWGNAPGQARGVNYFGANAPLFSAGIQGLSQLGNIYLGVRQLGLAKDSFNLQKRAFETNLTNSTSAYNTQIRDRIAGRSYATEEERQAALNAALLPGG